MPLRFVGLNNRYAEFGKLEELLIKYGLSPVDLVQVVFEAIAQKAA